MSTTPIISNIRHTIILKRPVARVWQALTTPAEVARWLGCLNYEAKPGHTFYMQPDDAKRASGNIEGAIHCEILTLDAPHTLSFSWFLPGSPKTTVTIRLHALDETQTELTLEHTGWDQFPPDMAPMVAPIRDGLDSGWANGVLPSLARLLEGT